MKLYISGLFFFLLMNVDGKTRDSTITLSRFEAFLNKPGQIVKTEITEV